MPDRTPQEREAARIERERRRAQREGRPFDESATTAAVQQQHAPNQAPDPELGDGYHEPESGLGDGHHDQEPELDNAHHDAEAALDNGHQQATPELDHGQHESAAELGDGHHDTDLETGDGRHDGDLETGDGHHDGDLDTGDGHHDADFETGEHELEVASGTRRISHLEKMGPERKRKPLPKRKPKPVKRRRTGEGKRRHSWLVRIASVVALLAAAAVIWFLVELFQPLHGSPHGHVTVIVPAHSSSSKIGDVLAKDGVISSSFFFELRATLAGERSDLRSGVYHLQQGMSYSSVLDALTKAPPAAKVTELTLTEGRNRHSIDSLLHAQHVKGSYLAATRSSSLIRPSQYGMHHPPRTLEGFLFPDTYQLVEPIKLPALVNDQLQAFKQNFAKVNLNYARSKHLTPYDVLIIASLVEAEAATPKDRPRVASVIYNRLADGMMLQFDSTTRFATGNYTHPLTVSQLHSRNPWNTHTHLGLPPTPIDNPGMAAIQAAAHPAHTNYLFFFTRPCGKGAVYASTYSQFLSQGSQHLNGRC